MSSASSTSGTTVSGLTTEAGRSTAGRGRGGRGRGRGGRGHGRGHGGRPPRSTGFRGSVSDMDGNVFECHDEQSDRRQFAKTVEALKGHVNQTLKNAEDVACLFGIEPKQPSIEKPVLPDDADEGDRELWREDLKDLNKRRRVLRGNLMAIEAIIWAQCSEAMKAKVKALKGYLRATEENDCKWFLSSIQSVMMQFDAKHKGYIAMLNATAGFVNCRQHPNQTADHYMEALRGHVDTVEYHGGRIALNPSLAPEKASDGTIYTPEQREKIARDGTIGCAYIRGSDPGRYGTLVAELSNLFARGQDDYPADLAAAYSMLVDYQMPTNANNRNRTNSAATTDSGATTTTAATTSSSSVSAVTFAHVAGTNGITHNGVTCYRCNATGHFACDCPAESSTPATTLVQNGLIVLTQHGSHAIDPTWILLDSQSTISVFNNPDMLSNIRPSERSIRALTNGGHQDSNLVGEFPNLGTVWFNRSSIANILSLAEVRKVCNFTMNTNEAAVKTMNDHGGGFAGVHGDIADLADFREGQDVGN